MPEPDVSTISVAGGWEGKKKSIWEARGLTIETDEPEARGGDNTAASPLETFLSGWAACSIVVMTVVCDQIGVTLEDVDVEVAGDFDKEGFFGKEGASPHFFEVRFDYRVKSDAGKEEQEQIRTRVLNQCPVHATLARSETDVIARWSFE